MHRKVSINTVVSNKLLLQAYPDTSINDLTVHNNLRFEIKVILLNHVDFDVIDEPELVDPYICRQNGNLWLLELKVKNIGNEEVSSYGIMSTFALMDNDDCIFPSILDDHLTHNSKFSVQFGLYETYWNSYIHGVESTCVLLFYLPDEDEAEYYLFNKGGFFDGA